MTLRHIQLAVQGGRNSIPGMADDSIRVEYNQALKPLENQVAAKED
jgi:hypothetical protein